MKNIMKTVAIGSVIIGGTMMVETRNISACEYPDATVTAHVLNIRSGHGTNYSVIGKLKKGDVVSILEIKPTNGFIKIANKYTVGYVSVNYLYMMETSFDNLENWVNKNHGFDKIDTTVKDEVKYNEDLSNKELVVEPYRARVTANLNFRKSKEIRNDNKIQVIRKYSEVKVLATSYDGKWARVLYLGKEGFVSTQYIKTI